MRSLPASRSYRTMLPEQNEAMMWAGSVLVKATESGIPRSLAIGKVQRQVRLLLLESQMQTVLLWGTRPGTGRWD